MPLSFPQSPTEGDEYTYNGKTYTFNGVTWSGPSAGGGGASVDAANTAPADPSEGDLWLDTDTGEFSVYVGGGWLVVGGGEGAIIESATTAPANPTDGTLWLDTDTGIVSVYYGTAWISVSGGETDFSNIAGNLATSGTVKAGNPFYLNTNTVSASFTIPANTNAMSAGPITLADDVTITVPDGSEWTVV